jgi:hypothetical protein
LIGQVGAKERKGVEETGKEEKESRWLEEERQRS